MLNINDLAESFFYHSNTSKTNSTGEKIQKILEKSLINLTENERIVFFIIYIIVFLVSMFNNIATVSTTHRRKIRLMQKFLIVSLALSDIIVCLFYGVNNMINFSHKMSNWILGEFMCSFVPYMQIVGSVANSITMSAIALDRYKNIVHPLNKQWDPNIWLCIVLISLLWGVSAGISYPMMTLNILVPMKVLIQDPITGNSLDPIYVSVCMSKRKQNHFTFFSVIFSIIFLPLMIMFLWLYYKIAKLIWQRRKPVSKLDDDNNIASITLETSTDSGKTSVSKQTPVQTQINKRMKSIIKSNKLHMERKIRTFKIILVIMLVFFICRIPHWLFSMIKLKIVLNQPKDWIMANVLSCLLIVNTALNPFLYSFLNQTIMYFDKVFICFGDFVSKVCCCCCSNHEFDDFEKENPFMPEIYNPRPSQTSSIIPRGPYMDCVNAKSNHVKFHDIAVINMYPKDHNSTQNLNCNTY